MQLLIPGNDGPILGMEKEKSSILEKERVGSELAQ